LRIEHTDQGRLPFARETVCFVGRQVREDGKSCQEKKDKDLCHRKLFNTICKHGGIKFLSGKYSRKALR